MRLKLLVAALAAVAAVGSASAQRPQILPTSKTEVVVAAPARNVLLAPPAVEPENTLNLDLSTGGRVVVQLRPDAAPNHVERIKTLVRQGFYNGLVFHRVIEGFMAQGGDPKGDGTGGSPLPDLTAEFSQLPHVRGAVSAARAEDKDSANSQFFIMLAPRLTLDNKYTIFGRVISGMEYVDAIERGEPPASPSRIVRASIGSDNVPVPSSAELTAPAAAPAPLTAQQLPAQAPTTPQ
jgi:peptidylprolyl isomerase